MEGPAEGPSGRRLDALRVCAAGLTHDKSGRVVVGGNGKTIGNARKFCARIVVALHGKAKLRRRCCLGR